MVSDTVALFVPLLLAVVTTLSSFLRDNIDLVDVVKEERPNFPLLFRFLPPLGRFTVIHLSNITLLLIGINIVKDLSENQIVALIGALVLGIFLLILPIIEIDEYGLILSQDDLGRFSRNHITTIASR